MSKLAQGQRGADLGSPGYFAQINSGLLIAEFLPTQSGYDYFGALGSLAGQATAAIATIHGDLQTHQGILRYVSSERRNRLSRLVNALSQLCSPVSPDTGLARDCLSMLSLLGFSTMSRSMATDSEVQHGVDVIRTGGSSGLDSFSRASTAREAAQWGESFAAGADETKRRFLQELMQKQSTAFLKDVWDAYNFAQNPGEYCGTNGCEFCSDSYVSQLEGRIFPRSVCSTYIQVDYASLIRDELRSIAQQIESDLATAHSNNDYLTDALGDQLRQAVASLDRCGVTGSFALQRQIDRLCWFTPISPSVVTRLQQSLNRLGWSILLKEDGVYGEKTSQAVHQFYDRLKNGRFPSLQIVDVGREMTDIGWNIQSGAEMMGKLYDGTHGPVRNRMFGLQNPRANLSYKISTNGNRIRLPATRANYIQVSKNTYDALQKFQYAKTFAKVAERYLIGTDVAMEAMETLEEIGAAQNQADDKISAATGRAVGGFAGSMGGLFLTVKGGGAIISAATVAFGPPGLIIAGVFVFAASGPARNSIESIVEEAGEWVGQKIGEIFDWDPTSQILDITEFRKGGH